MVSLKLYSVLGTPAQNALGSAGGEHVISARKRENFEHFQCLIYDLHIHTSYISERVYLQNIKVFLLVVFKLLSFTPQSKVTLNLMHLIQMTIDIAVSKYRRTLT